jgi:hypothetical protein
MEIRTSTVAIVAASCITAGAAGAFLASRPSSHVPQQTVAAANVATDGVEQSEALVTDTPAAAATPVRTEPRRLPAARATKTRPSRSIAPVAPTSARPVAPLAPLAPLTPVAPLPPAAPPAPKYVDLVVSTDSVLGLEMQTSLSSEQARVEDEVLARVTRDVRVGDRVAIPAGSQARGEVTMVERGGKMRDRARLGIRFTSVVLADGTRVPVETDTVYREGDSPAAASTAKIGGGAIGGAILGGIFGGAKGAAIGAATGAGAGTAIVAAGGRSSATLPSGTPVTVRLTKPATVTLEE